MKLIKACLFCLFAVSFFSANAQFVPDYKRTADKYYAQGDYYSAAVYYEKYLTGKSLNANNQYNPYAVNKGQKNSKDSAKTKPLSNPKGTNVNEIASRIAEGYRSVNDFKKAEDWYAKLSAADKTNYPLSEYWLGVCQRASAKFSESESTFNSFIGNYKQDDEYSKAAKRELQNLVFLREQKAGKEKNLFKIGKTNLNINQKECGHYAPFVQNGVLYFTSTSKDTTEAKNSKLPHINHLYAANDKETVRVSLPGFDGTDQGVASFTPNGSTLFFTRRIKVDGKDVEAIYKSSKNLNGVWSEAEKLGADINPQGAISKQPNVTADGKYLLFSSNMSGGQGKYDIWYSSLDANGNPSKPTNMGTTVNSKEDEEAPYYHNPSMQLVFASKGRVGMGGFDLFTSKGKIGNNWSEPKNIGYPINSEKDDIYFYSNDDKYLLRNFYMSSDRESVCLEMYSASKVIKKYVSGKVVDSKTNAPLEGVTVSVTDDNGNPVGTITTGGGGNYFFETDPYNSLKANAQKDQYKPSSEVVTGDFNIDTLMRDDWKLEFIPPPPPPPEESKPLIVRFEFDKFEIMEEYKSSLDSLAALMLREQGLSVEIGGYTDEKGSEKYNLKLSNKRAEAGKQYLIDTYKIDEKRLSTKGYGKCCPIEKEVNEDGTDNPEGRKANRRLEFKIQKL